MKRTFQSRKLESFKLFPYIAWGLIILFVVFVYKLSTALDTKSKELEEQTSSLESKVEVKNRDLKNINFEQ
jgi:hypothetical protein